MILQKLRTAIDRKLQKFLNKEYRDGYLSTHVRTGIGLQIRALREKMDLTQEEFATLIGKKQSVISRLEDTDYGRVSIQTLLDVASATDVAVLVRFVDYPQFLRISADMSPRALAPDNVYESAARAEADVGSPIFLDVVDPSTAPKPLMRQTKTDVENEPFVLRAMAERQAAVYVN